MRRRTTGMSAVEGEFGGEYRLCSVSSPVSDLVFASVRIDATRAPKTANAYPPASNAYMFSRVTVPRLHRMCKDTACHGSIVSPRSYDTNNRLPNENA